MTIPQSFKRLLPIILVVLGVMLLIYLITWQPAASTKAYTTYTVAKKDVQRTIQATGMVITKTIDDEAKKVVQWYVSEDQVKALKDLADDQAVTLDISALDTTVDGKIHSIADQPRITGDTTDYEVIVTFDDEPEDLLDGMHADTTVVLETKADVLAVPNNSLTKTDDDTYSVNTLHEERRIYLKRLGIDKSEQTLETKTVEIGLEGDDYTEITSGLNSGSVIVAN